MNFSLDQLHYFAAVAEEKHFGRAAQRLHITQPPLSRQIQKLEAAVGFQLFERGSRGVRITAAGTAFLADARRVLALVERAPEEARLVAEGSAGRVAIGFTATVALGVLGRLLREVDEVAPGVKLVLEECVSREQENLLAEGRLDLGLMRTAPDERVFPSRVIRRERLLAAIPSGHALAQSREPLPLDAFDGAEMIGYSPTTARYFADLVATVLVGQNVRSSQQVTQVLSMCALVAAGRGFAIVPESALALRMDSVTFRPIAGREAPIVELRAAWRADAANPSLTRLLATVGVLQAT